MGMHIRYSLALGEEVTFGEDTSAKPSTFDDVREIVKAGSSYFAIVANMQTKELRIGQRSGVQINFGAIRILEMPWFRGPVLRNGNE